MKVKFYLKSGKEIEIECEKIRTEVSKLDGSLVGYEISGTKGRLIHFLNMRDVSAITREE